MIARVFPTKTSMSPTDEHSYFDAPDMFTPQYDEVRISVTFTWDIPKAQRLAFEWKKNAKVVKVGGVAIDGESTDPFVAGVYLKQGVTITSRGCPNHCAFCMVNKGNLIEFDDFPIGNIVQDNNILACSDRHIDRVFEMLKTQKRVNFKGGLEAERITPEIVDRLSGLRIEELWLACDSDADIKPLRKAARLLNKAKFGRWQMRCYCLIRDDYEESESRITTVYNLGFMPFAQLYIDKDGNRTTDKRFLDMQRRFCRPAATASYFKNKDILWHE